VVSHVGRFRRGRVVLTGEGRALKGRRQPPARMNCARKTFPAEIPTTKKIVIQKNCPPTIGGSERGVCHGDGFVGGGGGRGETSA